MKVIGLIRGNEGFYSAIYIHLTPRDPCIYFVKNKGFHNINGPSLICDDYKSWYYKDVHYGDDDDFTIKSWKQKVKELKYLESLKIFI